MGLALVVGHLADQIENDPEGAEWFRNDMQKLNSFLATQNLPPHIEPEKCEVYWCSMLGYSGLHYLRRVAASLALQSKIPKPGNPDSTQLDVADGDLMNDYLARLTAIYEDESKNPFKSPLKFTHLICHSDTEGYYIPQDFTYVLLSPDDLGLAEMIGSSNRLLAECEELALALELPLELDPEAEEVIEAVNNQGTGEKKWQQYGIEAFHCLRLHKAAKHSIETGAAIKFC